MLNFNVKEEVTQVMRSFRSLGAMEEVTKGSFYFKSYICYIYVSVALVVLQINKLNNGQFPNM